MIKNHAAQRSKVCVRLGLSAQYKLIMTGTPVANGPMDVFMQFEFLDPNILGVGDFYSFRNRYAIMGGYDDKQVIGYQNMPELIELMSPFVFQVRKSDVLTELPPKVYQVREVEMTEEQRRMLGGFPEAAGKAVLTVRELAGETGDIADPAMQEEGVFRRCRDEITRCLARGIERLLAG